MNYLYNLSKTAMESMGVDLNEWKDNDNDGGLSSGDILKDHKGREVVVTDDTKARELAYLLGNYSSGKKDYVIIDRLSSSADGQSSYALTVKRNQDYSDETRLHVLKDGSQVDSMVLFSHDADGTNSPTDLPQYSSGEPGYLANKKKDEEKAGVRAGVASWGRFSSRVEDYLNKRNIRIDAESPTMP